MKTHTDKSGPRLRGAGAAWAQPTARNPQLRRSAVRIPVDREILLAGDLTLPAGAPGVVLFAHGSGSSRQSPRNQFVARQIQEAGVGTLLFDLLTPDEEAVDAYDGHLRFDIALLAGRLVAATRWLLAEPDTQGLGIGYFGASTGGGAALVAAAELGTTIDAVVSRGGRPDLAGPDLPRVVAPTLLIVGEQDEVVLELNQAAYHRLQCEKHLAIVPRATHLFEEEGALENVASLAAAWFRRHLTAK